MSDPPTAPAATPSILRRLVTLAWPVIGLNVLNVLALAVDTAMVGRTAQAETALTGLGFATQIVFLLMVAMMGLTVGTVAILARAHGAGHHERVEHVLTQSSQLTVVLGVLVATVGNAMAPSLVGLLGGEGAALDAAMSYLRPLLAGSTFYYLTILYGASLRAVGNTRLAFGVALASNLVNFGLNYGLILGKYGMPALGIQGAAIGTVCSQAFSSLLLLALIHRGAVPGIDISLRPRAIDTDLARRLVRVGAPAAADMVILNASFLSIVGMLGRLDPVAVAAHGIGLRIQALAFVPGMSISQATGAMVGNALGAGNRAEAQSVVRSSVLLCTAVMSSLALLIVGLDDSIVALFDVPAESDLAGYTKTWMWVLGACMPLAGIYISFVGLFQGAGATRLSLRINLVATLAVQIPLSALLGFGLGLGELGVWLGFPLGFVVKAAMGWFEWKRERWAKTGATV